jgi:uncharacterized protein YeaO (DUF488 family)
MRASHAVTVRRLYDPAEPDEGRRVLVDRLWPRGLSKATAADVFDEWCRDVAPTSDLRRWYGHDPQLYPEFRRRYLVELADPAHAPALAHLRELGRRRLALLTATKEVELSHATVLAELLGDPEPGRR